MKKRNIKEKAMYSDNGKESLSKGRGVIQI